MTFQKKPIILSEDKIVYKALEKGLISPYIRFIWELNKLYETKIKTTDYGPFYDEEQRSIYRNDMGYVKDGVTRIGQGFHSFTNIEYIDTISNRRGFIWDIYECMIPAGSEYYEDKTGLCVSNKLIIKNKIQ